MQRLLLTAFLATCCSAPLPWQSRQPWAVGDTIMKALDRVVETPVFTTSGPLAVAVGPATIASKTAGMQEAASPRVGNQSVEPAFFLNGAGTDIDSLAFWESDVPEETLLFVTGKANNRIEIWQFPFLDNEQPSLLLEYSPNGIDVDQDRDLLLVGDATNQLLVVYSLPDLSLVRTIGQLEVGPTGETNVDVLDHANGEKWVYVSDDYEINAYDLDTGQFRANISPPVESLEELLADSYHQVIYVPDEQGNASAMNPGGVIFAYNPDGSPYLNNGNNAFADQGIFDGDQEGMVLLTCPLHGASDDGSGLMIQTDQSFGDNGFEIFDRERWEHLDTLQLVGVSNTDGIASTQRALPGYPLGIFAAVNNDSEVAIVGWGTVFHTTGLSFTELTCSRQPRRPSQRVSP